MKTTSVFEKNIISYNSKERLIINKGGSSSSKTYSILQLLHIIATTSKKSLKISVVSESMPHIKMGARADYIDILKSIDLYDKVNFNKTDSIFEIGNSFIQFFSADDVSKVHGPRRDILYLNECNNIPFDIYEQLKIRTHSTIFLDYNPVQEFWVDTDVIPYDDHTLIHSTYLDNEYLNPNVVKDIEGWKIKNPNKWKVYGLGQLGKLEGVVFSNWQQIDSFPLECKWVVFGLDWGFSNDPTALVKVGYQNGKIYLEEILYQTGLINSEIADHLHYHCEGKEIIADSAEPKSIEELSRLDINIRPSIKGKDSVKFGIDKIKEYDLFVTKNSLNLIKELRHYTWKVNKQGKSMNEPIDGWNHIIDAFRYVVSNKLREQNDFFVI